MAEPAPTDQILTWAGQEWILKPIDQGSSVGLMCGQGPQQLAEALAHPRSGKWLCEQRIHGKDLTVGVLHGKAMGAVQIEPDGGIYDFHHKYTAGKTKYLAPAPLPDPVYAAAQSFAETAFKACGCRDFARIDFLIDEKGFLTFLEINTIPGLTPTSLLPKSAACVGMNFSDLLLHMIAPAEHRFNSRLSLHI
ncbi:MAG: hypothetical protein LR015_15645 [Verrucomicrobia bacterium]|nr:hypothetical protein [Verrucomicrobiota bacterium]